MKFHYKRRRLRPVHLFAVLLGGLAPAPLGPAAVFGNDGSEGPPVLPATHTFLAQRATDQDDMTLWVDTHDPRRSTIITADKKADRIFVYASTVG